MLAGDADHRRRMVLETIVEHHVLTAQPVSSAMVAKKTGLGLSCATIRGIMADLEEEGYLEHRHVSAGRMPTDRGYRLYVDKLMRVRGLTKREKEVISEELTSATRVADEILKIACRVLSRIWGQLALGLGPGIGEGVLERIDLIPVASERVFVVVSIASGVMRTVMIDIDRSIDRDKLEASTRQLNDRLVGLPLSTVLTILGDEPGRFSGGNNAVRQVLVKLVKGVSKGGLDGDLYMDGTYRVLVQPEFESRAMTGAFLSVVEAREPLVRGLSLLRSEAGPRVMIGRENSVSELDQCSLVAAGYRVGRVSGAIGVLGPLRMPYSKLIPAVRFIAKSMGEMLS